MTETTYELTKTQIELIAFKMIRQKARNAIDPMNNDELASYVKGVVDLQYEIYNEFIRQNNYRPQ